MLQLLGLVFSDVSIEVNCQFEICKCNWYLLQRATLAERTGGEQIFHSFQSRWTSVCHSSLTIILSLFLFWVNFLSICWAARQNVSLDWTKQVLSSYNGYTNTIFVINVVVRHRSNLCKPRFHEALQLSGEFWISFPTYKWNFTRFNEHCKSLAHMLMFRWVHVDERFESHLCSVNGFCRLHPTAGDLYSLLNCHVA